MVRKEGGLCLEEDMMRTGVKLGRHRRGSAGGVSAEIGKLSFRLSLLSILHPLVFSLSDSHKVCSSRTKIARLKMKVPGSEQNRPGGGGFQSGHITNVNDDCSLKQFPACRDADT